MISLSCAYCAQFFLSATPATDQNPESFQAAWKRLAATFPEVYHCTSCGGRFGIEDDGVDVGSGGSVQLANVSQPRIDSLNAVTGAREGGNALVISGSALDIGTLVVKFAGQPCLVVDSRTATTARVVLPTATYALNVLETCHKLTLTIESGSLSVDESVTTSAGSTGVIRQISGATYMVAFVNLNETLDDMLSTSLTGGGTGGIATIYGAEELAFLASENVAGLTSGANAIAVDESASTVTSPTKGFAPDELVQGSSSGALVKLKSSPAYSGLVDVTVENEHGQRLTGGTLLGAYTYA